MPLLPVDHDPYADGASVPGTPTMTPVDHDPYEVGNPMGEVYPPQGGNAVRDVGQGVADYVKTPGSLMQPNPYPAGSEEAQWYENNKADTEAGFGVNTALSTMGTGVVAGVPARAGETVLGAGPIRAYHGSPHDFDKFDISKIGTGEGAQAYGHGLYFAENPAAAQFYRDKLAPGPVAVAGDPIKSNSLSELRARSLLHSVMRDGSSDPFGETAKMIANASYLKGKQKDVALRALDRWKSQGATMNSPGKMYEVNINAHPEQFLDWDKPITQQPPGVRKTFFPGGMGGVDRATPVGAFYDSLKSARGGTAASASLREAGIPGIKYLDQGSRGAGAGSSNYVLFNDKLVTILRKYGIAGLAALPPAVSAEYKNRLKPVDHDPFAE